jgi:hypothetical protein
MPVPRTFARPKFDARVGVNNLNTKTEDGM